MKYRFKPTQRFWESFYALSPSQKESTRRAWKIFQENPFDPRLRPHKIHKLSARFNKTITRRRSKQICELYSTSRAMWW